MTLKTKILSVAFFAISFIGFAQSNCKDLKGCERKLCELNIKLTAAKKAGNQNQIKGVEDAISQTKKNCTTKTVNNDLDKKVKEKQQKVNERTADLNEAIKDKESKEKIDKKRKKLDEEKADLNKALAAQKTK
jgi:predicted RNase H-like nuclease (RuvC/YqgF family)